MLPLAVRAVAVALLRLSLLRLPLLRLRAGTEAVNGTDEEDHGEEARQAAVDEAGEAGLCRRRCGSCLAAAPRPRSMVFKLHTSPKRVRTKVLPILRTHSSQQPSF